MITRHPYTTVARFRPSTLAAYTLFPYTHDFTLRYTRTQGWYSFIGIVINTKFTVTIFTPTVQFPVVRECVSKLVPTGNYRFNTRHARNHVTRQRKRIRIFRLDLVRSRIFDVYVRCRSDIVRVRAVLECCCRRCYVLDGEFVVRVVGEGRWCRVSG